MTVPVLVNLQNSQIIGRIDKPVVCIGRAISYCDIVIENFDVSRAHCNILCREDSNYFIVDTQSTNRTSVGDTILKANEEYPLKNHDYIKISNEIFLFVIPQDEV